MKNTTGESKMSASHARHTMLAALSAGVSLIALASSAWAADASQDQPADTVTEVVVTGSRIQTPGFSAPTPVTALTATELQRFAPSNVADGLNKLPQFQNSFGNNRSRTFSSTSAETVQGNYLNLRGLGVNRVLVMLDGVRVPPTDASGGVDLNTLPQMLVKRIDVVTGGASAAYGSDAVTGVVNFVLDKTYTGVKAVAQAGVSSRGDAKSWKAGVAAGARLGDHGHVLFSAEHYEIDGLRMYDRRNGDQQYVMGGNGQPATPYTLIQPARFNSLAFGGLISSGPLAGRVFQNDGSTIPFNRGVVLPVATTLSTGGDGAYYTNGTLNSPLRTDQVYTRVSYDITPRLNAHAQAGLAESRSTWITGNVALTAAQLTIFSGNAYLSPAVQTALGATPSFTLGTLRRDIPSNTATQLSDSMNLNAGLDGSFGKSWTWDVNYNYGRSYARQKSFEIRYRNLYAALDAVRDPSGSIVCRATLTNPSLYPGCVPVNLFGEGNITSAALDYIRQPSQLQIINELSAVGGNMRGELFHTWAGPIAVAFGAETRRQNLDQTSNANPAIPVDFTGLRGVPANTLAFARLNGGVASGSVKVTEGYAEAGVPILRDSPFAEALDLNGALRVTNYSTSGTVTTWKAGFVYRPISDLRIRATVSRDIAAPTLNQLFAGATVTLSSIVQSDPHTGATGQYQIITAGNPDLKPESARTVVAGFVYQPSWLPGFSLSIDAYRINIADAISTIVYQDINLQCEASGGTAPVCNLIKRPLPFSDRSAANFPLSITVAPLNLASIKREGLDLEASYRMPAERLYSRFEGNLQFRAFASYSPTYERRETPTSNVINYAGYTSAAGQSSAYPKLSGSVEVNYTRGPLAVAVLERFTGGYNFNRLYAFRNVNTNVANVAYTDLNVSYDFGAQGRYQGFVSVQNLLDKDPPFVPDSGNAGLAFPTNKQIFDVVGRYVTTGVRVKF